MFQSAGRMFWFANGNRQGCNGKHSSCFNPLGGCFGLPTSVDAGAYSYVDVCVSIRWADVLVCQRISLSIRIKYPGVSIRWADVLVCQPLPPTIGQAKIGLFQSAGRMFWFANNLAKM